MKVERPIATCPSPSKAMKTTQIDDESYTMAFKLIEKVG